MKNRDSLLVVLMLCIASFSSAQVTNSHFLLEEFQDAIVHLKRGAQSHAKLNYNLVSESFFFIGKDGEISEIANPDEILIIRIGDRAFYQEKTGGVEILPTTPAIYVQYKANTRSESPKGAYGTGTETSSVTSYTGIYSEGKQFNLDIPDTQISRRYNIYWIEKKNKRKQFRTFKQLVKLYPKHKKVLEEYIKENNILFEDVAMITKLCLYAESL